MSRYVKVDILDCPCSYCEEHKECKKEIEHLPTIDIVHCKECTHYSNNWCEILKAESMTENGFCAYGERIEE